MENLAEDIKEVAHVATLVKDTQPIWSGRLTRLIEAAQQVESAFQMLEVYGVPRTRARFIATGIDVLGTRMSKEIHSIEANIQMAVKKFIDGEISAGKFGESIRSNDLHGFKKACRAFDE